MVSTGLDIADWLDKIHTMPSGFKKPHLNWLGNASVPLPQPKKNLYPLVNVYITMQRSMGTLTILMDIFCSDVYTKLPEGDEGSWITSITSNYSYLCSINHAYWCHKPT